jgi:hypothetical protein
MSTDSNEQEKLRQGSVWLVEKFVEEFKNEVNSR